MELINQLNEMMNAQDDMRQIADQWAQKAHKMSDDDLITVIGNDLEMIEYTPAQINDMVPIVLGLVRKTDQ